MTAVTAANRCLVTVALVIAAAAACSTGSSTGPTGGGGGGRASTGSLAVTVAIPSGVTPSVTVLGPDGYTKTITAATTLAGLAPGSYTVAAAAAMGPNAIVGVPYAATVGGSPATVTAGATARATVTYTQRASEGYLFVAHIAVSALAATQLGSSGTPTPSLTLTGRGATQLAIDASGGVWTCYAGGDSVSYFTPSQALAGGSAAPAVTIIAPGQYADISGIALDAGGDLWISDRVHNAIYEYTPGQLRASGSPTPADSITAGLGTLDEPWALAFDAAGDLWVANVDDSTVVAYSPSALNKGGPQVPFAGIALATGSAWSLAFDSSGDLWVGDLHGLKEFPPSDLSGVGSPTPAVALDLGTPIIAAIAFDASGDLWAGDQAAGKIYMFTPEQFRVSGSPTPATTISNPSPQDGTIGLPTGLAFSPHAVALPLH